jgi:hypothetical protein
MRAGIFDVRDVTVKYVARTGNTWQVNISYFRGGSILESVACLEIDDSTEKVIYFKDGYIWT